MVELAKVPTDARALIAIDLGAESCRVSLLRWINGFPEVTLVHRFPNAPRVVDSSLRWDLVMIETGLHQGLRECAAIATEGVRSIGVDGWAVDYVRLNVDGSALCDPVCYRDERTVEAEKSLHGKISRERLREITGLQLLRINTIYQLHADYLAGVQTNSWLNLPEYFLSHLGGAHVAERTNATHCQLMDMQTGEWCEELFQVAGVDIKCAPRLVPPGTILGKLVGPLSELAAYRDTVLIAPACHDTASAIAGIPAEGDDWAYISSGTWSLVGTLLDAPLNDFAVRTENFTNLAGVGGKTLFHKNVNGLWLLRQCMAEWEKEGNQWSIPELIQAAQIVPQPPGLLDVDDPQLILAGAMPSRINLQRQSMGLKPLAEHSRNAPAFASLIFHSLAARYAAVLGWLAEHSGRKFKRLYIVGGGSRNEFLNRLTEEATGLPVFCGSTESSTIGNFAVQLAALTRTYNYGSVVTSSEVSKLARLLLAGPNA